MRFLRAPGVFEGLTLAGVGPLAFQGLGSAAAVSPDDGSDSPLAAHLKRSCRPVDTVKSTLTPRSHSKSARFRDALSD
jgi:hypothetical protein